MRKFLFACAFILACAACANKHYVDEPTSGHQKEVPFKLATNYFFRNDQQIPVNPKITTAREFEQLFGMAAFMGKNGMPTEIDFSKEFVLAVVLPVTDVYTEITPLKVEETVNALHYTYEVKTGEKLSYTIQPLALIIVDRKYADKQVLLLKK